MAGDKKATLLSIHLYVRIATAPGQKVEVSVGDVQVADPKGVPEDVRGDGSPTRDTAGRRDGSSPSAPRQEHEAQEGQEGAPKQPPNAEEESASAAPESGADEEGRRDVGDPSGGEGREPHISPPDLDHRVVCAEIKTLARALDELTDGAGWADTQLIFGTRQLPGGEAVTESNFPSISDLAVLNDIKAELTRKVKARQPKTPKPPPKEKTE